MLDPVPTASATSSVIIGYERDRALKASLEY